MSTCDFEDCVGQGWWGMAQACSCLTNADITRYDLWTWQMWRLTGLSVGQEAFVERFLNIFSEKMHWTRLSQHKEDSIDFNWWQSTKEETTNSMKNYNHNIHAFDVVDQLSMCVCVCVLLIKVDYNMEQCPVKVFVISLFLKERLRQSPEWFSVWMCVLVWKSTSTTEERIDSINLFATPPLSCGVVCVCV